MAADATILSIVYFAVALHRARYVGPANVSSKMSEPSSLWSTLAFDSSSSAVH